MATHSRDARARSRAFPPPNIEDNPLNEHTERESTSSDVSRRQRPSVADRWRRIAAAAYLRAERRGFAGGAELEDWLEAEKQVDAELREEAAQRG